MTKPEALDLLMLLSALESWAFSLGKTPPDYLIERTDKAIELLRAEVLPGEPSAPVTMEVHCPPWEHR